MDFRKEQKNMLNSSSACDPYRVKTTNTTFPKHVTFPTIVSRHLAESQTYTSIAFCSTATQATSISECSGTPAEPERERERERERKRERERDDDDDDDDDTLLLKDRDLSTGRLVYKSVPDDKYNNQ